jgi:hypothetical protein
MIYPVLMCDGGTLATPPGGKGSENYARNAGKFRAPRAAAPINHWRKPGVV